MTRICLLCWMMVALTLLNLQHQGVTGNGQGVTRHGQGVTGHGQGANEHGRQGLTGFVATGPPLNCDTFSTRHPTNITDISRLEQEKVLSRFVACIEGNRLLDIDGLYFVCNEKPIVWDTKSKTGLMAATVLGFNELARRLIHYYADINVRNEFGTAALHHAAMVGNNNMIGILLGLGANVNGVDNIGSTPLHMASYGNHVSTVRLLLERGADINARQNTHQGTALGIASYWKRSKVVALLQSWGR